MEETKKTITEVVDLMAKRFMEDSEDYTGRYRISGHTVEFVTIAYRHTHRYSFAVDENEYISDSFEEFIDIYELRKNKFLKKYMPTDESRHKLWKVILGVLVKLNRAVNKNKRICPVKVNTYTVVPTAKYDKATVEAAINFLHVATTQKGDYYYKATFGDGKVATIEVSAAPYNKITIRIDDYILWDAADHTFFASNCERVKMNGFAAEFFKEVIDTFIRTYDSYKYACVRTYYKYTGISKLMRKASENRKKLVDTRIKNVVFATISNTDIAFMVSNGRVAVSINNVTQDLGTHDEICKRNQLEKDGNFIDYFLKNMVGYSTPAIKAYIMIVLGY